MDIEMVALRMKCILCDSVKGNLLSSTIISKRFEVQYWAERGANGQHSPPDLALLSYRIMGPGTLDKVWSFEDLSRLDFACLLS